MTEISDPVADGLNDCGKGVTYREGTPGEAAAFAAYAVLRCCNLIRAGDWRVPNRIGATAQEMVNRGGWSAPDASETAGRQALQEPKT